MVMWPTLTPSMNKSNVTLYHRLLAEEKRRQNVMTSDSFESFGHNIFGSVPFHSKEQSMKTQNYTN